MVDGGLVKCFIGYSESSLRGPENSTQMGVRLLCSLACFADDLVYNTPGTKSDWVRLEVGLWFRLDAVQSGRARAGCDATKSLVVDAGT